jgi:hypothetical protein
MPAAAAGPEVRKSRSLGFFGNTPSCKARTKGCTLHKNIRTSFFRRRDVLRRVLRNKF